MHLPYKDGGVCRHPSSFVSSGNGEGLYDLIAMNAKAKLFGLLIALIFPCVPSFSQATPSQQQQISAHMQKAQEHLREKRPDLAIPEFKTVISLDPDNVNARANLGVLLFFQGDYANAAPHLRAALKLQPDLGRIQALLGMCEKRIGETAAARTDLETSLPKLEETKIHVEAGMELIEIYSASGELEKAASIVGTLRQIDPANVGVLYVAYRIYSDLAGEAMLDMSLAAPKSAQMHQVMAHELAKQDNAAAAIANYREALKIDPKLPGLHFELAEMLHASSDPKLKVEAEEEYKAAVAANHLDEKAESRLGDIAAERGDAKTARQRYQRALQLQPNDAETMLSLAKLMMEADESDKALPLLQRSVELDPTNATAHYRLSMLYRKIGRSDDAKHELEQYQKYKELKEQLRAIYKEMRIELAHEQTTQADEQKPEQKP